MKILFAALFLIASGISQAASQLDKREELFFFPDYAWLSPDGAYWTASIHGWDYRPETDPSRRRWLLGVLARTLHLPKDQAATADFERRARWFLGQNHGGRTVQARNAGQWVPLKRSRVDGHIHDQLKIPRPPAQSVENAWATVRTDVTDARGEPVTIPIRRLGGEGVLVVSDLDDTIKVTGVGHRHDVLLNTFSKPYQAVEGMNKLFQQWAAEDRRTVFFYVSASPWPLYQALSDFLKSSGFPRGLLKLKHFRWKDESFFSLWQGPEKYKTPILEELATRLPQRCFVLVGDSGEKDPEIYGAFARRHPDRTVDIYIRDISGSPDARYLKAFAKIDHVHWHVFQTVKDLGVSA